MAKIITKEMYKRAMDKVVSSGLTPIDYFAQFGLRFNSVQSYVFSRGGLKCSEQFFFKMQGALGVNHWEFLEYSREDAERIERICLEELSDGHLYGEPDAILDDELRVITEDTLQKVRAHLAELQSQEQSESKL